jgi:chromosome segregation ATPase
MLKLNEAQQKHEASQNKARELQIQLLEAKLAQQKELAELEAKRAAALQRQFEQVTQTAAAQQHKLSEYDSKFSALQEDMQRANGLFAKYQAEMERVREALQRAESDKLAAEKLALQAQRKLEETQLAALAALEERGKVIERLQRDRDQLSKLCKLFAERGKAEKEEQRQAELVESLQQELRRQAAAATPAAPEPAPAPAPAPVLVPAPQ